MSKKTEINNMASQDTALAGGTFDVAYTETRLFPFVEVVRVVDGWLLVIPMTREGERFPERTCWISPSAIRFMQPFTPTKAKRRR